MVVTREKSEEEESAGVPVLTPRWDRKEPDRSAAASKTSNLCDAQPGADVSV